MPVKAGRNHARGVADQDVPGPQQAGELMEVMMSRRAIGGQNEETARAPVVRRRCGDQGFGQIIVVARRGAEVRAPHRIGGFRASRR